ncbi:hypothetical protein NDU88_004166 [Pleurodeles waltl]|uniref:Uncharacterized protein n=1 Tax=Pleurodeles waltl TaxID=8319 RepID=A0AAV7RJI8_PLEWA|nr:hypothetical protein NDU88_004166 [Pleurodeles waltl]
MEGTIDENTPVLLEPWLCLRKRMSPYQDFWGSPANWNCHRNSWSATRSRGSWSDQMDGFRERPPGCATPYHKELALAPVGDGHSVAWFSEPQLALRHGAARGPQQTLGPETSLHAGKALPRPAGPHPRRFATRWAAGWRKGVPIPGSGRGLVRTLELGHAGEASSDPVVGALPHSGLEVKAQNSGSHPGPGL